MAAGNPKVSDVMAEVRRLMRFPGAFHIHPHQGHRHPDVTRPEIEYVLAKTGRHRADKGQYSEEFGWKYRVEGQTLDGDELVVVVSFIDEPPLSDTLLLVITAFHRMNTERS